MPFTNEQIIARFGALQSQRKTAEQTLQWIERFVCPFRGKFFRPQSSEHEIEWQQQLIFDSTAIDAAQTLAASIHGALTNPSIQWFGMAFRDKQLNSTSDAREWLDVCANITYLELKDSNFELEVNEHYLDLVSFGTASLVEEIAERGPNGEWRGLDFQASPLRETFFEEDHHGRPLKFYRLFQWYALQIVEKFGKENVPEAIVTKAHSPGSVDSRIDVIFCIYPRMDKRDQDISKQLAPKERPWGFKYVLREGLDTLGEEGGYYEMPAFLTRWLKVSGSRWGHSPSHIVLPTIMSLNRVKEIFMVAAEKGLDPPMLTEQRNIIGDLNQDAASLSVVRDIDKIKAMVPETRMDMSMFEIQDSRDMIRKAFHLDQLELKNSPAMTATEVLARVELMNRLLGPTMGRLQSDLFDPLIQRTFNILWREGRLPEAPQSVIERQSELDIEYTGPLARSQKVEEVTTLDQFIAGVVALSEINPDVLQKIDFNKYIDRSAELRQIPAGIVIDTVEAEKRIKEMEAKKAIAEAGQLAQEVGAGMKSVGEGAAALQTIDGGLNEAAS